MVYVYAVLMLIVIVIGHEAAHAITGMALGYKPKLVAIGIPIEDVIFGRKRSTIMWRRTYNGVEYMISPLLLGGGVDFYDFEDPPFWKISLIALAGPVFNLLAAFFGLVIFLGWMPAVGIFIEMVDSTLIAMGMVTSGHISVIEMAKMGTLIVVLAENSAAFNMGWLLNWLILNVSLGLCNLFPLPAVDGGQIMMAGIVALLGERFKTPAKKITYGFFIFIFTFLFLGLGIDLWTLIWI